MREINEGFGAGGESVGGVIVGPSLVAQPGSPLQRFEYCADCSFGFVPLLLLCAHYLWFSFIYLSFLIFISNCLFLLLRKFCLMIVVILLNI